MVNQLKQGFFQVFTFTSLWVTLLLTIFFRDQPVEVLYLWRLAGIAAIAGVIFGVMYNVLWNHFTLKPLWNILIGSILNIASGMFMVWLFSVEMFGFISAWWPGMLLLSILLHTVAFYFYARANSRKSAEELNKIVK